MHKKTLKDNGVKLISCMENIPDTPEGIILESLLEGMAEYYSAELSQKVLRGMNESRQKGLFTGGQVIFGYKVMDKKVVIDEDEAKIVRWMFNECASGRLIKSILQELNEKGIMHNGKPLKKTSMYNLMVNEKYIGIHRHGDEVFTNIYPPIVPVEIFNEVKHKLDKNKYGKHKPNVYYLLRNKCYCGYCGHTVSSDAGTSHTGKIMRYYKCYSKRLQKSCELVPIRKEVLESLVIDVTTTALNTPENLTRIADLVFEAYNIREKDNSVINVLTDELKQVEKSISNILDCMEKGISTDSTKERLEKLELRKRQLQENIVIEQSKNTLKLSKEDIIQYITANLRKETKQMIDLLVKRIEIKNDEIQIYFHYTNKNSPDGKLRWGYSFYQTEKSFIIEKKHFSSAITTIFRVICLI